MWESLSPFPANVFLAWGQQRHLSLPTYHHGGFPITFLNSSGSLFWEKWKVYFLRTKHCGIFDLSSPHNDTWARQADHPLQKEKLKLGVFPILGQCSELRFQSQSQGACQTQRCQCRGGVWERCTVINVSSSALWQNLFYNFLLIMPVYPKSLSEHVCVYSSGRQ